jgi:bifunctional DNA-binding transcriptional regulator/antitoxin component of YhaV-PrlF toxin-antitoxin module
MAHVVGSKGQIVIAKDIRDQLGVEPGWLALQRLVNDHVEVYFLPPEHRKSLKGSLANHIRVHVVPGQEWDKARDIAWDEATKQKVGAGGQIS